MADDEKLEAHFNTLNIEAEDEKEETGSEEDWEQLDEKLDEELVSSREDQQKSAKLNALKEYPTARRSTGRLPSGPPTGSTNSLLLEGFPESFKTGDLTSLFDQSDASPAIKWINDTSAIAVFPTSTIAKRAYLQVQGHPFMSITPYTSSVTFEQNSEAVRAERPAMTDMVARRLIAGALGVRPKQKSDEEKQSDSLKLDQARELRKEKRKERQSRREASDSLFDS